MNNRKLVVLALMLCAVTLVVGCKKKEEASQAPEQPAAEQQAPAAEQAPADAAAQAPAQ